MRHATFFSTLLIACFAHAASAKQPPDVVSSDTFENTAMGTDALLSLTPGGGGADQNTAAGYQALYADTTGNDNTAVGTYALNANLSGAGNAAFGGGALSNNTSGNLNTAVGLAALQRNQTGGSNAAVGQFALVFNTSGSNNTAVGSAALYGASSGASGSNNTGIGANALGSYTIGSNNIAIGNSAGYNLTSASNNIDIGNKGVSSDSGVIRIGTEGVQTGTQIAGIYGVSVTGGLEVVINSKGKLGVKSTKAQDARYDELEREVHSLRVRVQEMDQLKQQVAALQKMVDGERVAMR